MDPAPALGTPPAPSAARPHWLLFGSGFLVFILALLALHRASEHVALQDVLDGIRALDPVRIALALACVVGSYGLLTVFDAVGVGLAGGRMPRSALAATAFMANALGHNLGMAAVTGGAVRLRGYGMFGLDAVQVAQVVATTSLGFALGACAWLGVALLSETAQVAPLLASAPAVVHGLGLALLAVPVLALAAGARGARRITLRGRSLRLPGAAASALLLATSVAELACAAGVLYFLLPEASRGSFIGFVGLYLVAISAGLVSTVPAGLGVFEAALVTLLPGVPTHDLLGAIVVYRGLYYLVPLGAALAVMSLRGAVGQRRRAQALASALQRLATPLLGPTVALAAFGAGAALLVSGSLPLGEPRREWLALRLPLPVLEVSHLVASTLGVGLLLLARGLQSRLDAAWRLAAGLLAAAIPAVLLAGLRWELALVLALLLGALCTSRRRFDRPAELSLGLLDARVLLDVGLVVAASVWLGLFAHRHVEYANTLWWQFAFESDAPRMLRASLVAVLSLAAVGVLRLLRPAATPPRVAAAAERERAAAIVAQSPRSDAQLALLPDKQLLFDADGRGLVMFQRSGPCLVAMGDPVAPMPLQAQLAWAFRERAAHEGLWPVFYQVSAAQLPTYLDMGLSLTKLGEEAVVSLPEFTLEGPARAELRQAHRRAQRDGAVFEVVPAAQVPALLPELRAVSDDWLAQREAAEKGFSLGWWDTDYLARFDCAVVRAGGAIVAFANIWRGGDGREVSVDLMRHADGAPRGTMDFLFVELMLWARARGHAEFVLGMAPLAGLSRHQLAPAWHKLGSFVRRHGDSFYRFEGLHRYKAKFDPTWRPRYLASPGGLRLPRVLLEVSRLIAGGPRAADAGGAA